MLQLLQPIQLLALGGILVPLAIHLWNSRQNKLLQVGSIALLEKTERSQARRIRIDERLLLLLRCLLVAAAALLLAHPVWTQRAVDKEKGWVLLRKNAVHTTYAYYKPGIDSLLKAGYQLHYFDKNFEKATLRDTAKMIAAQDSTSGYWQLYSQLDTHLPAGLPVVLFTDNLEKHFTGTRPVTWRPLQWFTYTDTAATGKWVEDAYAISADSLQVITARSTATATLLQHAVTTIHTTANDSVQVTTQNGLPVVAIAGSNGVAADTSILRATVFAPPHVPDAGYVTAALHAIAQYTQRRIQVTQMADATHLPAAQNWLFWLSDQPLPGKLNAGAVLRYQHGQKRQQHAWITTGTHTPIELYQWIEGRNDTATTVWQNSFGEPVLTRTQQQAFTQYLLYTHFNAAWNNLAWDEAFPQMLLQLLFPEKNNPRNDLRAMDNLQVQPVRAGGNAALPAQAALSTDLTPLCWLLLLVLFAAERWCAFQPVKRRKHAAI